MLGCATDSLVIAAVAAASPGAVKMLVLGCCCVSLGAVAGGSGSAALDWLLVVSVWSVERERLARLAASDVAVVVVGSCVRVFCVGIGQSIVCPCAHVVETIDSSPPTPHTN